MMNAVPKPYRSPLHGDYSTLPPVYTVYARLELLPATMQPMQISPILHDHQMLQNAKTNNQMQSIIANYNAMNCSKPTPTV